MPTPTRRAALRLETEMTAFNAALQRYARLTEAELFDVVRATAFDLQARVQKRTPVDTGRLRNSIHTELGGQRGRHAYRDRRGRTFDGALLASPADPRSKVFEALVGTNVEYALPIEAGHSRQAPSGMFAVSAKEMRGQLEARIRRLKAGKR